LHAMQASGTKLPALNAPSIMFENRYIGCHYIVTVTQ
jgi:hypothetical protein